MSRIHPQAIVDPSARLADDVEVGPWTLIGPEVEIGAGSVIGSHVVIKGPTRIGRNNRIFQFASVGEDCQDKKYNGEPTRLEIGDNNVIREGCTIHRGTVQDQGVTRIGSNNLLMAYVHVAHDCVVGDNIIMANNATIAGHVQIGNGAILGGYTTVHQFCHIGAFAMSAANSAVFKDIPAFVMVGGNPAGAHGMNFEGMRRRGYSAELVSALRRAYKVVYRQGLTLQEALAQLEGSAEQYPEVALYRDSILASTRGITR
ncbi:acyl-ACP--UDP-N-acetylglucosamine O-acyltransferase [Halopseudomonas phragmitis]|uniref:Acyl-[acyl-carrier-protein]--UDP-N-acetylglucosamine O-acyltransferase n=2 Tax=Pseudomonadaceae TaxID=135621 RepID=A0A1V0B020_9GAMM|nr:MULTISPECIES: acyl-ACP--UDP-N-acetylglucosamine O-acyltransferase [Pseudomonadaceae]AQZ93278.1 acyl-[acyl-carrier-protein]--UDP-N-acetylglucosamine O-acyltransferase [Halopseudomonas phragmitis]RHW21657.1 acyl-ACP--UDP-N-acetylglucosamine O-acyltransferase [Pseudomonas jilinensis]